MKSPFPGMDPYLEEHWGDVHTSMTTYARDQLAGQLPPDLRVRVEEYTAAEADDGDTMVPLRNEPPTLRYLRITDVSSGNRLVTAIEFLHSANKAGEKRIAAYRDKRLRVSQGGASFVEIDLLRAGEWVFLVPQDSVPAKHQAHYRALICRAIERGRVEYYGMSLQSQLPTIPVPLRQFRLPAESDVLLNLQELINQSYEAGRYDDIDYKAEPIPPLDADDARWADALLREKGLR